MAQRQTEVAICILQTDQLRKMTFIWSLGCLQLTQPHTATFLWLLLTAGERANQQLLPLRPLHFHHLPPVSHEERPGTVHYGWAPLLTIACIALWPTHPAALPHIGRKK